jgi:nucleotide-binding universal stress UspA family protein
MAKQSERVKNSNRAKTSDKRIVVGVDGSDASEAALTWAIRQAKLTGAVVDAIIAWQLPLALRTPWPPELTTDFEGNARHTLTRTIKKVRHVTSGVKIRPSLTEGNPTQVLLDAAKGADLLVVGARGHGGYAGALLGSVGQHCVHHAHCPVVIVRDGAVPA